jgi:hypothetical protein
MAKAKKRTKSKKSSVRVRDLKASKNPKGGIGSATGGAGAGKIKFNE